MNKTSAIILTCLAEVDPFLPLAFVFLERLSSNDDWSNAVRPGRALFARNHRSNGHLTGMVNDG